MDATRCLDDFDPSFDPYSNSNLSHSWLMDYPPQLKPDPTILKISSKNEEFTEPEIRLQATTGKRKKLMEAFYRKIISEDVFGGIDSESIIIEDYKTDYMDHYQNPDDLPIPGECLSKNEKLKLENKLNPNDSSKKENLEELKSKYPLYTSRPLTFVSQITGKENFRKNSTITKPPDKNYDNIEY